jgi:hypothetical protein
MTICRAPRDRWRALIMTARAVTPRPDTVPGRPFWLARADGIILA